MISLLIILGAGYLIWRTVRRGRVATNGLFVLSVLIAAPLVLLTATDLFLSLLRIFADCSFNVGEMHGTCRLSSLDSIFSSLSGFNYIIAILVMFGGLGFSPLLLFGVAVACFLFHLAKKKFEIANADAVVIFFFLIPVLTFALQPRLKKREQQQLTNRYLKKMHDNQNAYRCTGDYFVEIQQAEPRMGRRIWLSRETRGWLVGYLRDETLYIELKNTDEFPDWKHQITTAGECTNAENKNFTENFKSFEPKF